MDCPPSSSSHLSLAQLFRNGSNHIAVDRDTGRGASLSNDANQCLVYSFQLICTLSCAAMACKLFSIGCHGNTIREDTGGRSLLCMARLPQRALSKMATAG